MGHDSHDIGAPAPSAWFKHLGPQVPGAGRVICFPHSGGTASAFRPLGSELAGELQVVGVQYPGRQDRHDEALLLDLHELADHIAAELRPQAEPWVFLGHSMGAITAYEVAQRLGPDGPTALLASGRPAPSALRVTTNHLLDDEELAEQVIRLGGTAAAVFEHAEMRSLLLPVIRGDYRASETYRPREDRPLRCTVIALGGAQDPATSSADLRAWSAHTTGAFRVETYPGGHFFIHDHWPAIAGLVRSVAPGRPVPPP